MTAPATPGQAAYEAWHAKLAEHHPGIRDLREPYPWNLLSADVHAEWEAAAQAAIDAATEGTIRALGFTLEDVARFIAAQAPDDGRHPDECPCQFCREDRREAAAQDDDDEDGYPDSEREADALAYQRNGDDERDDQ